MAKRTMLHGTCLVHGRHAPGVTARECPVLKGRITPRENARRVGRNRGVATTLQAPPPATKIAPKKSGSSNTVSPYSAGKGGRPRQYADVTDRKREEMRRYRARKGA